MKKKILNLIDMRRGYTFYRGDGKQCFRVESLTNTTKFEAGEMLDKSVVDAHCKSPEWTVNIKKYKNA